MDNLKSISDIANELNISRSTIASRINRYGLKADVINAKTKLYGEEKVALIQSWFVNENDDCINSSIDEQKEKMTKNSDNSCVDTSTLLQEKVQMQQSIIDVLKKENDFLHKQVETLSMQNSDLTKTLSNVTTLTNQSQILQAKQMESLTIMTNALALKDDENKKVSFWDRIFKRKGSN